MIKAVKNALTNFKFQLLLLIVVVFSIPAVTLAQGRDIQSYLSSITIFVNTTIIPFFFAVAILFLFVNVTRYFVIDAADAYKREEARKYMMLAVIGLVFITSIWGVINLVTNAFGIDSNVPICPDYIDGSSGGCGTQSPMGRNNNQ